MRTGGSVLKPCAVIERVLVRPMTATEVVIAVVEAGYRTTMKRTALRNQ